MTTDAQTQPNTTITSAWGAQVNDRVVQIFDSKAQLVAPHPDWDPVVGTLAYTTAEKGLWRCLGNNTWESALARGKRAEQEPGTQVDLTNASGAWTWILGFGIGDIRYGCTYMIEYSGNPYTKSSNMSLWGGQVYLRQAGIDVAEVNVYRAGGGWPASIYSSVNQAGFRVVGPMPRALSAAEVVWRGSTYPGMPVVTVTDIRLSVTEVGGPQ